MIFLIDKKQNYILDKIQIHIKIHIQIIIQIYIFSIWNIQQKYIILKLPLINNEIHVEMSWTHSRSINSVLNGYGITTQEYTGSFYGTGEHCNAYDHRFYTLCFVA